MLGLFTPKCSLGVSELRTRLPFSQRFPRQRKVRARHAALEPTDPYVVFWQPSCLEAIKPYSSRHVRESPNLPKPEAFLAPSSTVPSRGSEQPNNRPNQRDVCPKQCFQNGPSRNFTGKSSFRLAAPPHPNHPDHRCRMIYAGLPCCLTELWFGAGERLLL